ncbi:MAG: AAA family ATPase [Gammaproteobacteria bacterium]|nr:AAA family ATPase [Gammaproteobacteria bacterium]
MKVTALRLRNIRCFRDLTLRLNGASALFIGDNGDGKSTVLRSLAMGLCDNSSASALFRDLYGESVSHDCDQGTIEVDLAGRPRLQTRTTIRSLPHFEQIDQTLYRLHQRGSEELTQAAFPWSRIFAVGYGPGIRVQGTNDYDYYLTVDALYPLFVYDTRLQNPELVIRRLVAAARPRRDPTPVLRKLKKLLALLLQLQPTDSLQLTRAGIFVKTRRGQYPLSSLGDGYRSTVTWVLDLVSWWYLRGSHGLIDVNGVVLIDEIEQHLHPRWQRNIMQLLTQSFPNVQFLATTHSPLVASGCEGIPVHRLNDGEHTVGSPFGWRAEDVYQMMGLSSSRARAFTEDVLERYQRLDERRLRQALTPSEETTFNELRARLKALPGDDPLRLATELANLAQLARASAGRDS